MTILEEARHSLIIIEHDTILYEDAAEMVEYVSWAIREAWEEKEDDHRLDRYDYPYSRDQLNPWMPQIKEGEQKTIKVRIYFNNHARA